MEMIDAKVRTGDRERLKVEKRKRKKGEGGSGRWKAKVLGRMERRKVRGGGGAK